MTALMAAMAPVAGAAGGASGAIDVELAESLFVQDPSFVAGACRGLSKIGCTVFTSMKIVCGCSFEDAQWRIRWRIHGNASMFVTTPLSVRHESQHVKDLRVRLESLAARLESSRFEQESECEEAVDKAIAAFPDALHDVIRLDVLRLDMKKLDPSQIVPVKR